MMQITHAATGALAGSFTESVPLAFLLGIIVHFIIDKIPHFWREGEKKLNTMLLIVDYALAIAFICALYFIWGVTDKAIYAGIAGGLITDIVLVGLPFVLKSRAGVWHAKRQPHEEELNYWALLETAIVAIIVAAIALGKIG